jgi:hypothetical protein
MAEWHMIAVNRRSGEIHVSEVTNGPFDSHVATTRAEALTVVDDWQRYNEFWTYGLLEGDYWTPRLFGREDL